jgi:hypothetical protein
VIYFVQATDGGPVKIGTTVNLSSRLASLQSEVGKPLCVLAVADGGVDEEGAIHRRFDHLRNKPSEWFIADDELTGFVAKHGRPWDGCDEQPLNRKLAIISLKGTPEFAAWLADFAEFCRLSQADAVEHGLVCLAREKGFRDPPAR